MSVNTRPIKVLIVDPHDLVHHAYGRMLAQYDRPTEPDAGSTKRLGRANIKYKLVHAHSPEVAKELVKQAVDEHDSFAVVVSEFRFTDKSHNGVSFARDLWQVDPHLQVIIATAEADLDWLGRVSQLPSQDQLILLRKPFTSDELIQLVRALADKWRLTIQVRDHVWSLQTELDRRLEREAQLRQKAEFDPLTRLPNRALILSRMLSVIDRRQSKPESVDALLFLDLDNFKTINDSLGHRAGDDLLNQVANRLRSCVRVRGAADHPEATRSNGEVARLGGDEFVVLLESLRDPSDALKIAQRVVERLCEPYVLDGRPLRVGASVGVAYAADDDLTPDRWLQQADTAMYRAKLRGKRQTAIYDHNMHADIESQLGLEASLREAVSNRELEIYYQPIYDLRHGRIYAVEALLRWIRSDGDAIPPSRFIPIAEELGLINDLGYWTIAEAASQLTNLQAERPELCPDGLVLSVNLSRSQISEADFADRVGALLDDRCFPRQWLKLEVTEEITQENPEETAKRLQELHQAGFGIWMDDFGSGQSSLSFFHQLQIETVKIDRAFVSSFDSNKSHQAIVEAVVRLAHSLDATVVAEGLESFEQVQQLKHLGCDLGQGYYFAPPVPLDQLIELLRLPLDGFTDRPATTPASRAVPAIAAPSHAFPTPIPDLSNPPG